MNIQLLALSMTMEAWKALLDDAVNAAKQVGRREAKRANLYLVCEKQDPEGPDGCGPMIAVPKIVTTFDNTAPGLYALLLCSVRWSPTQTKYVSVVNNLLEVDQTDPEYVSALWGSLNAGLEMGKQEWEAAQNHGTDADALLARVLIASNSTYTTAACFAEEEDAKSWATLQSNGGDYSNGVEFISAENMTSPDSIGGQVCEKLGLSGLWRAWVSTTPKEQ